MRATNGLLHLTTALVCALLFGGAALAQSPAAPALTDPDVVPDDMLTLVVGTHFVGPAADGVTAKAQFTDARIPLAAFNETDRCIDQRAVEVAQEYFTALGRLLGKAGLYYFVPEDEIKKAVTVCERLHGQPPQAWVESKTKIIAFGKVVPTVDAPALEKSIR
jgi:hypothetical protein